MTKENLGRDFGCTKTLQKEWERLDKSGLELASIINCLSFTYGEDKVNKFIKEKNLTKSVK